MKHSIPKKMKPKGIKKETTFGDEVLHGLNDFLGAVDRGEPITVRTLRLNLAPSDCGPDDVRLIRKSLNVSQAVLARLMGVSSKTIQSWEQGTRPLPGPARRLLDEFKQNRNHWVNLIRSAVSEQLAEA